MIQIIGFSLLGLYLIRCIGGALLRALGALAVAAGIVAAISGEPAGLIVVAAGLALRFLSRPWSVVRRSRILGTPGALGGRR